VGRLVALAQYEILLQIKDQYWLLLQPVRLSVATGAVRRSAWIDTMRDNDKRWPMFNRVLHQAQQLDEMMRCLVVDPALAARQDEGEAFARARIVCLVCPFAEACRRWLAQAEQATEPPGFCPNAEFFATSRRKVPVSHAD
jgi:hypothetical protein